MNTLRITTAELANLCGVSQGTVDRALNNRSGIKPETKQRILQTAAKYGFRSAVGNEKPRDRTNRQIGVIVFNLNNDYFTKLITEIEASCRAIGYTTIVMFTNYDEQREIESIRWLYSIGVEGIILSATNAGTEFENYLRAFDIPIVAVANRIQTVPYVGIDDFTAMKTLTEYVLQSAYQKIIYFSPAIQYKEAYAQKRRLEGFLEAIPKHYSYSIITDIDRIQVHNPEDTAIICSTDYYALKVYFRATGCKLFGFDNVDILDKYQIPITSVGYSIEEIAGRAVSMIVNRTHEGNHIAFQIVER